MATVAIFCENLLVGVSPKWVNVAIAVGSFYWCVFKYPLHVFKGRAVNDWLMHIFRYVPFAFVYIMISLIPIMLCGLEVRHIAAIVVTQDYGLAAMCLARSAMALNQDGMEYTAGNIDALLLSRHTAKKIRNAGGRLKGPAKRTAAQDRAFSEALIQLLQR